MPSLRILALTTLALALAASATAYAQPAPGATEADTLFRRGRERMLAGAFAEACPLLAESQRLEPHIGTLLNLAACHEREGKVGSAWIEYQQALTAARADGHKERERFAASRIEVLGPRVPWLTVTARGAEAVKVALDGAELAPAALGKELPLDPGPHTVTATGASGDAPYFSARVVSAEGAHDVVDVPPATKPAPAPAPTLVVDPPALRPPPPAAAPPPARAPEKRPEPRSRWRFEAGLFVSALGVHVDRAEPVLGPASVSFTSASGALTSCASASCSYSLRDNVGAVAGLDASAGYMLSEETALGARLIAGPRFGGGGLGAVGPAVTTRLGGPLWGGLTALLGTASTTETGQVNAPSREYVAISKMRGDTDLAVGAAVHLDLRVLQSPHGALALRVTPMFLLGSNGSAWGLPFGVSYTFE